MLQELKQKLDQQYFEMYPGSLPRKENGHLDWVEIIGSIVCVAGIAFFGYLWFKYL